MVVREREQRARLGDIYRKASDIASAMYAARERPAHMSEQQYRRFMASGGYLWEHTGGRPRIAGALHAARAQLPPRDALPAAVQARYEQELEYAQRIRGASIYPAVQNVILACRALGLATPDHHQSHPI